MVREGSIRERNHLEDLGTGGKIKYEYIRIKEILWEGMHWFNLAQDMDRWQTVVNTVINFRFIKYREFLEELLTC